MERQLKSFWLSSLYPTMLSLALELQQPYSPWSAVMSPHTHDLPHGEGTALPSRDWPLGNTFWALAGLLTWDQDTMVRVLPPVSATNCFYLIRPISVTSVHTCACVWRWFGILHSMGAESGRGDQTTVCKGRNNIRQWEKPEAMTPAVVYRRLSTEMTGLSQSLDGGSVVGDRSTLVVLTHTSFPSS